MRAGSLWITPERRKSLCIGLLLATAAAALNGIKGAIQEVAKSLQTKRATRTGQHDQAENPHTLFGSEPVGANHDPGIEFAPDSPLEGDGFEPSVVPSPEARMLKAITNFVVERRRLVRQRRRQVVGEANSDGAASHREIVPQQEADNSDPLGHPEVPPQVAETQPGEPPAPTVWGKLKWFNPGKRYGFVELSDGSGDAFLHASALAGMSIGALQPGVTLELRTAPAQRGLQVTEVHRHR